MGKREPVPNWQYTDEFKLEAVKLAESSGGNQAAKHLGIPGSSLWNWIRLSRADKLKRTVAARAGKYQAESGDRKKAAAYFARELR